MLRHGGAGHPKGASQLADGTFRLPQQIEDRSSCRIRDCSKHVAVCCHDAHALDILVSNYLRVKPTRKRPADGLPALRDPAGQGGRLPDPRRHLRLVELLVLVNVEVAHVLVFGLAGGKRTQ